MNETTEIVIASAPPSSGWRTSEFGAAIATVIALSLNAIPPQYAPIAAAITGVYIACRSLLKAAHSAGYAKQIPDLPEVPSNTISTTVTQRKL